MTNTMTMTDNELLRYGRSKSKVTVLENELLIRLEQKLEDDNGHDARGKSKEESQRLS